MTAVSAAPAAYFTLALDQAKEDLARRGVPIFDFGVGDPIEPTPPFIRQALIDGLDPVSQYPTIVGQRRLRQAPTGRNFGSRSPGAARGRLQRSHFSPAAGTHRSRRNPSTHRLSLAE